MDANSRKELAKIACNVRKGIIEGTFKSLGRTLKKAVAIDEKAKDEIPSTKGVL